MKKLMFALTAVAATVAVADVVSSNIVGYQNEGVQPGFRFIAAPFTGVDGGESFKLKDLKTNCCEDGSVEDGWIEVTDAVVELTNTGSFKRRIVYVPEWYADGEEYGPGWYDDTDTKFSAELGNSVEMPFGYGVQVNITGARNQEVTYSGAVKPGPTVLDLAPGFRTVGNCACKNLYLKDLLTNCCEDGSVEDGWIEVTDAVVELTNTGSFKRRLVYVPEWYAEGETYSKGWYDSEDKEFTEEVGNEVMFPGGTGFQVNITGARNQKITIKSALATDAE